MPKFILVIGIAMNLAWVSRASAVGLDAIKAMNRLERTGCIDLEKQSTGEDSDSSRYRESLHTYLKSHLASADRQKGITGFIAGVGTAGARTVLIFTKESSLAAQPGQAFRSEHRKRLESLVAGWKANLQTNQQFTVRFSDECDVPVGDWK